MTPEQLAERYIREAADAVGAAVPARKERDTVLSVALLLACQDVLIHMPGGFDRSATLAKAGQAAKEPPHL